MCQVLACQSLGQLMTTSRHAIKLPSVGLCILNPFTHGCCVFFTPRCSTRSAVLLRQIVRPSVCLFVSPSVTFRYRSHIGWNSSKIISWPISLYDVHPQTKISRIYFIISVVESLDLGKNRLYRAVSVRQHGFLVVF